MPANPYQDGLQSTLRRDAWSGPGSVTASGQNPLEGFDQRNMADPNMQTAKYQGGRIFSRFDPNDPSALASVLNDPEFKAQFGNAKGVGPDKIDFGDGRPVDVIRGHGAPGAAWAWQTEDGPATVGQGGPGVSGPMATPGGAPASPGQSDLMAQILASLQDQQPDPQALLQQQLRY